MKGWLAFLRTLASEIAYFSCFFKISVFFLRALRAYILLEAMCLARNTFPKAPDPRVLIISKEEKVVLLSEVRADRDSIISFWFSTGFSEVLAPSEVGSVDVLESLLGFAGFSFSSAKDLLFPSANCEDPNPDALIFGGFRLSLTDPVFRFQMESFLT